MTSPFWKNRLARILSEPAISGQGFQNHSTLALKNRWSPTAARR
jgi:hypothetical protein